MATLADLAERMMKQSKEIEQNASDRAVDVALTILADVAVKTPVDTSKAASNWQTTIGAPANSEIDAHFPGTDGSTAQSSVDATYNDGKSALEGKKPGQSIFITNNAKHIKYLNDGSSYQAPAGFVERSVMLGQNRAKNSPVKVVQNGK